MLSVWVRDSTSADPVLLQIRQTSNEGNVEYNLSSSFLQNYGESFPIITILCDDLMWQSYVTDLVLMSTHIEITDNVNI